MGRVKSILWNGDEGRLRATLRVLVVLVLWLAGFVGINLALIALFGDRPAIGRTLTGLVQGVLWTLLMVWLAARFLDRRRPTDFRLHLARGRWWGELGAGIALLVVAFWGLHLPMFLAGMVEFGFPPEGGASLTVALLFYTFGIAFSEEFVFRGYLLKNAAEGLRSRLIPPRAALAGAFFISALVFSFFHWEQVGGTHSAAAMIAGHLVSAALMSAAFLLTGSLAIPVGLHFANNALLFVLAPAPGGAGEVDPLLSQTAYKLVALALVLLYVRLNRGSLRLCTELAEYEPSEKASGKGPVDPESEAPEGVLA